MKLVFATHNKNKLDEIQHLLKNNITLLSLHEVDFKEDIPETQNTVKGNASQKAGFVYQRLKMNCFADDTGLEVESLNGEPGVKSARYAGKMNDPKKNIDKLLLKLDEFENRNALFRTVISLVLDKEEFFFEGIVHGHITRQRRGNLGFGYDPVFIPVGYNITFAEMSLTEKNKISHRAIAFNKLVNFLNNKI